ncbi:MAG: anti-sigma factor [Alphaproteobacteria bacterium]|nr:anti-sigma factor [Alphaproteobacteria bacterium]MDE1903888.1 anti-sigma factor [Alphaproteobacteria bacterium]
MTRLHDSGACEMTLLVQADFDGELDAAQAAALAAHRADCPICQAATESLGRVRRALREQAPYHRAPDALRARLAAQAAPRRVPSVRAAGWRRAAVAFVAGGAIAASVMLAIVPSNAPGIADQVLAGHLRGLEPGHLEDVVSTDQHTVKPWFDGKLDFAPPVKDLKADGFPLEGGRLDYLGGRRVAAMVYGRAKHVIDLYAWPEAGANTTPVIVERDGYTLIRWRQNGMALWAVSDVEKAQLEDFCQRWRTAS